jgi:hypothetical protein
VEGATEALDAFVREQIAFEALLEDTAGRWRLDRSDGGALGVVRRHGEFRAIDGGGDQGRLRSPLRLLLLSTR